MAKCELPDTTLPDDDYLFYKNVWYEDRTSNLDNILHHLVPLLSKGETAIGDALQELTGINPGDLDQSRLLKVQMDLSRWQIVSQLLTNFASGIVSGLKNTLQNIR